MLLWGYLVYLFGIWTTFRYFSHLPVAIEELWFKPMLWLVPILWINLYGKIRIIYFGGRWFRAALWGLAVGSFYMLAILGLTDREIGWNWNNIGVGIVTSITENTVFMGFVLQTLSRSTTSGKAIGMTAVLFSLIHLPIALLIYHLSWQSMAGLMMLTLVQAVVGGWLMKRTGNIIAPIVASAMWMIAAI